MAKCNNVHNGTVAVQNPEYIHIHHCIIFSSGMSTQLQIPPSNSGDVKHHEGNGYKALCILYLQFLIRLIMNCHVSMFTTSIMKHYESILSMFIKL